MRVSQARDLDRHSKKLIHFSPFWILYLPVFHFKIHTKSKSRILCFVKVLSDRLSRQFKHSLSGTTLATLISQLETPELAALQAGTASSLQEEKFAVSWDDKWLLAKMATAANTSALLSLDSSQVSPCESNNLVFLDCRRYCRRSHPKIFSMHKTNFGNMINFI